MVDSVHGLAQTHTPLDRRSRRTYRRIHRPVHQQLVVRSTRPPTQPHFMYRRHKPAIRCLFNPSRHPVHTTDGTPLTTGMCQYGLGHRLYRFCHRVLGHYYVVWPRSRSRRGPICRGTRASGVAMARGTSDSVMAQGSHPLHGEQRTHLYEPTTAPNTALWPALRPSYQVPAI